MHPPKILSINSHVAFGHVGNSAAVFAMQRLGCEVWPVHTVQFSNHPGYGGFRGAALPARLIEDCVVGIEERGVLSQCDGVLSGYLGSRATAEVVLRAVERTRRANRRAIYCCDPVIGDVAAGVYIPPDLSAFLRDEVVPNADIVTPNHFELDFIAGRETRTVEDLVTSLAVLHARGPRVIVVTSLRLADTPAEAIDLAVSDRRRIWRVRTPRLPIMPNGAGDALAALFFVHWLARRSPNKALELAASAVFCVLAHTADLKQREIALIAAQDQLVSPTKSFRAKLVHTVAGART